MKKFYNHKFDRVKVDYMYQIFPVKCIKSEQLHTVVYLSLISWLIAFQFTECT